MKIFKCGEETKSSEFPLSWEQVKEGDGIYASEYSGESRIIVIKYNGPGVESALLYFDGASHLEPVYEGYWKEYTYRLTGERLCLEVRGAQ